MYQNLWITLASNAAMMLALFVLYEINDLISRTNRMLRQIITGFFASAVCIVLMRIPFELYPGVFFDTRTILLSVTAWTFGIIPAGITVAIAGLYRVIIGGDGVLAGVATIVSSAAIGLLWRRYLNPKQKKWRWLNVYAMSIAVHATMMVCMLLLPYPKNMQVIGDLTLPVMLIFPVAAVVLNMILLNQKERLSYQAQVRESEKKYRNIADNMSDVVWTADMALNITYVSPSVVKLMGENPDQQMKRPLEEKFPPDSLNRVKALLAEEFINESDPNSDKNRTRIIELEHYKADGTTVWLSMHISFIRDDAGKAIGIQGISRDITQRKLAELALNESERSKSVLISHIPGIAYRCEYDEDWSMNFISDGCLALTGYSAQDLTHNHKLSYNDLICQEYRQSIYQKWAGVVEAKTSFHGEYEIMTASGDRKWVMEMGQPIYDPQGGVEALEGIIIDITESKQRYNQIQYMNDHDHLTDLYNRRYFEEKKGELDREENLPLSIVIVDINGVRLINDAFGHAAGDKLIRETAKILVKCCPANATVARTGGDEFGILMPKTGRIQTNSILERIQKETAKVDLGVGKEINVNNVSLGYGTKESSEDSLSEIEKEAEENMYKHKLLDRESHHNTVIQSNMATMYARSEETEEHARRLAHLSQMIGRAMHLPQKNLDDLWLLAMLHDIGKIGINDQILNKPGKLTKDEWVQMKKHPEIGYRIAMSSKELEPVASYILHHHERWDGKGYPTGIGGEEIPLLSRILAVADSYDAMTEDRVYRKALTKQEALSEISGNAGKQYDQNIVTLFMEIIANEQLSI